MTETLTNTALQRDRIAKLGALEPEELVRARLAAFDAYQALPTPDDRTLGWRRTDFAGIDLTPVAPARSQATITRSEKNAKAGVVVESLEEAMPRGVARELDSAQTGVPQRKFSALTQAAWQGGGYVWIPAGAQAPDPIHIRWDDGPYPRLLIVLADNARATIVEHHNAGGRLRSGLVDIVLAGGAHLNYLHVQDCSRDAVVFSHQHARIGRNAKLVTLNFGIGGKMARTDVEVDLVGQGAESDMLGLVFGEDRQQFDYHTLQGHRAPDTRSDLLFKSALDDQSHSSYTGVIVIDRGAQRSDAYQANRNLLLKEGARADTEPMLEIEADDVRCTHGATVGPVDEEQLFYAQSRGLSPDVAARLIVEGFFEEVLEKFGQPAVTGELLDKVTLHLDRVSAL